MFEVHFLCVCVEVVVLARPLAVGTVDDLSLSGETQVAEAREENSWLVVGVEEVAVQLHGEGEGLPRLEAVQGWLSEAAWRP